MVGSCKHSDLCTFSFHPLKSITTGEGGLVTTNSGAIYDKVRKLSSLGIKKEKNHWKYDVLFTGFNFRLSDFQCALGISQLAKLNKFLQKRKKISEIYKRKLSEIKEIETIRHNKNYVSSNHLFLINIKNFTLKKKEKLIKFMLSNKIILQYHYIPIYKFKLLKKKQVLKNSEKYYQSTLSLPIFYNFSFNEQNYVIKKLKQFFKN